MVSMLYAYESIIADKNSKSFNESILVAVSSITLKIGVKKNVTLLSIAMTIDQIDIWHACGTVGSIQSNSGFGKI